MLYFVPISNEEAQQQLDVFSGWPRQSRKHVSELLAPPEATYMYPCLLAILQNYQLQNVSSCLRHSRCIFQVSCSLAQSRLLQRPLLPSLLILSMKSVNRNRSIGKSTRGLIHRSSYPCALVLPRAILKMALLFLMKCEHASFSHVPCMSHHLGNLSPLIARILPSR